MLDTIQRVRVGIRMRAEEDERSSLVELTDPRGVAMQVVREGTMEQEVVNYTFYVDDVMNERSSQRDVFESCARPLLDHVLEGYNCTLLACEF